jgi:thiazole synthase ThiGH ThiG subunit
MKSRRLFLQVASTLTTGTLLTKTSSALNKSMGVLGKTLGNSTIREVQIVHTNQPTLPVALPKHQLLVAPNTAPAAASEGFRINIQQNGLVTTGLITATQPLADNMTEIRSALTALCAEAKRLRQAGCQFVAAYVNISTPGNANRVQLSHWTARLHDIDVLFTNSSAVAAFTVNDRDQHSVWVQPLHQQEGSVGWLSFYFDENLSKNRVSCT